MLSGIKTFIRTGVELWMLARAIKLGWADFLKIIQARSSL